MRRRGEEPFYGLELGGGKEGPDGLVGGPGVAQPVKPEDEAAGRRHWTWIGRSSGLC